MDSIYFRTKGEGEFIVKREFPEVTIIRPAPVFGFEDRLLNFMAKCLRVLPGIPLIKRGAATIQPVYVGDIAAGIVRSLKKDEGEIYELAGPKRYKYHELGKYVAKVITEEYTGLPVPGPIASITGYLNEFVWRPVWTRDFAKRMKYDIVLDENTKAKTFKDLGIEPQPLEKHAPTILKRWKRSGTAFLDVNYKL
jgi:NADH dehydrogenase (ubiquinone) 1 alpha subcomplex subunit 9